ncbi:Uncharacterised protein [Vibrio cholerae]|uniref:Uncharacterized protein n=1 Tax=Vibrio cholerae TaxID=666 RepID=A0A656AU86_VIBCL|nr:Uncharacterised protein [Vibrio cholerae]CSB14242.1 Uncharacterised protein [Vibrio cholerae]CSB20612.1 Uncharacterised protein [Vibrio cholerae]CSB74560.1 Uncharacterised protein [Vibrio cholerae]CSB86327.1 Uncharacterised protein [Vibrio cholerae]
MFNRPLQQAAAEIVQLGRLIDYGRHFLKLHFTSLQRRGEHQLSGRSTKYPSQYAFGMADQGGRGLLIR